MVPDDDQGQSVDVVLRVVRAQPLLLNYYYCIVPSTYLQRVPPSFHLDLRYPVESNLMTAVLNIKHIEK